MTTASNLDQLYDDTPPELPPVELDRSLLERYHWCPFQGKAVEVGAVTDESMEAVSGSECHRVLSEAIHDYVYGGSFIEYIRAEGPKMRPDVQQDALSNLWPSVFSIWRLLKWRIPPDAEIPEGVLRSPDDVLRYQGGKGERDGQLSGDILPATQQRGALRITSEIDLLLAGESASEINEIDFKRWKSYTETTQIRAAFQFRLHAWLIFRHYPELEKLHVKAWSLPRNHAYGPVTFLRRDADNFDGLLGEVVRIREEALAMDDPPPQWAWSEKCEHCPAIHICPAVTGPSVFLNENPQRFVMQMKLLELAHGKAFGMARTHVEVRGAIHLGHGRWWGLKPKPIRSTRSTDFGLFTAAEGDVESPETPKDDAKAIKDEIGKALTEDNLGAGDEHG